MAAPTLETTSTDPGLAWVGALRNLVFKQAALPGQEGRGNAPSGLGWILCPSDGSGPEATERASDHTSGTGQATLKQCHLRPSRNSSLSANHLGPSCQVLERLSGTPGDVDARQIRCGVPQLNHRKRANPKASAKVTRPIPGGKIVALREKLWNVVRTNQVRTCGAFVKDSVQTHHHVDGRVVGDVDKRAGVDIAGRITPVPAGGGPVTVARRMRNAIVAHQRQMAAGWMD